MSKYIQSIREYFNRKHDDADSEASASYRYENPKTGEMFTYRRKGVYKKDGVTLRYKGKASI